MPRFSTAATLLCLLLAGTFATSHAQIQRLEVELTPIIDTETVRAGAAARVTLKVRLPEGMHVQSDKPRDPSLTPTVLAMEPPPGIRVAKIVYPAASNLTQEGQAQPLAVFGREFSISVHLTLSKEVAAGDLVLPARLQYQACDETMCYPPAKAETDWTLAVRASS